MTPCISQSVATLCIAHKLPSGLIIVELFRELLRMAYHTRAQQTRHPYSICQRQSHACVRSCFHDPEGRYQNIFLVLQCAAYRNGNRIGVVVCLQVWWTIRATSEGASTARMMRSPFRILSTTHVPCPSLKTPHVPLRYAVQPAFPNQAVQLVSDPFED